MIYLFILAVLVLRCHTSSAPAAASRGYSPLWRVDLSLRWHLSLQGAGSGLAVAHDQLLYGMRDLSGPGLEPVSPALAGGFFTIEPPGKPLDPKFLISFVKALSDSTIT